MQLRCASHRYRKRTGNKPILRVRGKPRQRFFQVQTPVKPSTQTELIINITAYSYFERYNTLALAGLSKWSISSSPVSYCSCCNSSSPGSGTAAVATAAVRGPVLQLLQQQQSGQLLQLLQQQQSGQLLQLLQKQQSGQLLQLLQKQQDPTHRPAT